MNSTKTANNPIRSASTPRVVAPLIVVLLFIPAPTRAERIVYRLDQNKSQLVVHLLKDGLGSGFAHDHVIQATRFSGQVTMESGKHETARITITVSATHLRADAPALRRRYKLKGSLSADDRREVEKHLRAPDQLHVKQYPTISFDSTRVTRTGKGRYRVAGKLTIRGVTRPVALRVNATITAQRFKGGGRLRFKQSSFGYRPYRAAWGLVKVKDDATLNVYLEGLQRD